MKPAPVRSLDALWRAVMEAAAHGSLWWCRRMADGTHAICGQNVDALLALIDDLGSLYVTPIR